MSDAVLLTGHGEPIELTKEEALKLYWYVRMGDPAGKEIYERVYNRVRGDMDILLVDKVEKTFKEVTK